MIEDLHAKDDVTVPDGILRNLEQEYNEVMEVLDQDSSLMHFKLEYDKLYKALKRSHTSEKMLIRRCQELTQELLGNAAKMQAAVKLSQGDHSTIEALKQEIENAWRVVDGANDKDLRARETIKTLKSEVASLQKLLQESLSVPTEHVSTLEELKLGNKRLQLEGEDLARQSETLTREIAEMTSAQHTAEVEMEANIAEMSRVTDKVEIAKQEHRRERNARERAEYQSRELLLVLKTRENELHATEARHRELQASVTELNSKIRSTLEKKQVVQQKLETVEKQLYHTQQSYNDTVDTTAELNVHLQELDKELSERERNIIDTRNECQRVARVKENDFKELGKVRQQIASIKQEQEELKQQRASVSQHYDMLCRERAKLVEVCKALAREQSMLQRQGVAEVNKREAIEKLIAQEGEGLRELDEQITRERSINTRLRDEVSRLEQERSKYVTESSEVNSEHAEANERLKATLSELVSVQKQCEESEGKLKAQQAEYEKVRVERNQLSKRLVEVQDDIIELKQEFKTVDQHLLHFKEELGLKTKKYYEDLTLQKAIKNRVNKAHKIVNDKTVYYDEIKGKCESMSQEVKQLVKIVQRCDAELSEEQQQFLKVSNERDVLGAQLIRRNDELSLLYEKLRLQQYTAAHGEAAYRNRLNDVRLLRLKLTELKRQNKLASTRASDLGKVKARLEELQFSIELEQARATALSEELENPNNSAHWRCISGADPTIEEVRTKLANLQKRLIDKSEECLEYEMQIEEKKRVMAELRGILARQPGPEVAQQINVCHKDLQRKNVNMKVKASELNMTSTRISELKFEAERVKRELNEMKHKYYQVKLKNEELMSELYIPAQRSSNMEKEKILQELAAL